MPRLTYRYIHPYFTLFKGRKKIAQTRLDWYCPFSDVEVHTSCTEVKRGYRKKGYATLIYKNLIKWARKEGIIDVLESDWNRHPAVTDIWKKLGAKRFDVYRLEL